jgi:hypothetical protein
LIAERNQKATEPYSAPLPDPGRGFAVKPRSLDLLFVDSSHVVKYGSDVQKVFYDILQKLPVGIFVHFHDIFFPFEYPATWLADGRYWNENYFLRSFLSYNDSWEIGFFNYYAGIEFDDCLAEKMPLCLKNTGASIYLKRGK